MEENYGRRFGNGHYPYRINIQMRQHEDYVNVILWLVRNIGGCERLPRVFIQKFSRDVLEQINVRLYADNPLWAIKHYNNGRAKFYFRDGSKAMLFKLAWAGLGAQESK